jgi:hypothetical protein
LVVGFYSAYQDGEYGWLPFYHQIGDPLTYEFLDLLVGDVDPRSYLNFFTVRHVDGRDFEFVASDSLGNLHTFSATVPIAGDFNKDGAVGAADYVAWRKNLYPHPSQYDLWRSNFGQTASSAAAGTASPQPAVPEPSSILLSLISLFAVIKQVTRRASSP